MMGPGTRDIRRASGMCRWKEELCIKTPWGPGGLPEGMAARTEIQSEGEPWDTLMYFLELFWSRALEIFYLA